MSKTLVAYLAENAPEAALYIDPHQPEALLAVVDDRLNEPTTNADEAETPAGSANSGDFDYAFRALTKARQNPAKRENNPPRERVNSEERPQLRTRTRNALDRDPLNAQGLRILAQLAESDGDEPVATRLMQTAGDLSLRESVAIAWLMQKDLEKQDYSRSLYYADALLRTRPRLINYAMPTLARIAQDPSANSLLKKLLAEDPPWRGNFFSEVVNRVSDVRTPLELLLSLKESPAPPDRTELSGYLRFLIGHKFYQLAYSTWLQFLPGDQLARAGLLNNGNFEAAPSGLPFDWTIMPGAGVTTDIVDRGDEPGRALLVAFESGRVEYQSVNQLVVLPPGSYRFTSEYRGEVNGPRGMKWRITCADERPIAESTTMTGFRPQWANVEVPFTVAADCPAQYIRLDLDARMASEQFVSGSFWFAELGILREQRKH